MNVITGYVFDDTQMQAVEKKIFEIRAMCVSRAKMSYLKLLQTEIESLVDNIVLGPVERPAMPVLDVAIESLNSRIIASSRLDTGTDYDFQVSLHVFIHDGRTFIRLNASNDIYSKQIAKIDGLLPYNLTSRELSEGRGEHLETWNLIMAKYKNDQPLGVNLIEASELFKRNDSDIRKIKFSKPVERADIQARRYLTNVIMQKLGCNDTIPPFRTMEFFDIALLSLSEPKWKEIFEDKKKELVQLLPIIDYAMITQDPKAPVAQPENTAEATENAGGAGSAECASVETTDENQASEDNPADNQELISKVPDVTEKKKRTHKKQSINA